VYLIFVLFLATSSIAITTPGKYKCIKANAIANLIPLINDPMSEMRVNALKVSVHLVFHHDFSLI